MDALDTALARRRQQPLPDPETARFLRRRAGLSLADIAAVVGVSHVSIWHWETGRRQPRDARLRDAYAAVLKRLAVDAEGK